MPYAFCNLVLRIEFCESLKQKRSFLSPLLARLKKYNLSVIETNHHDDLRTIALQLVLIRANESLLNQELVNIRRMIETEFPNLALVSFEREVYF